MLVAKSAVAATIQQFCTMIETQFGREIQGLCSDNARDFFNTTMDSFFASKDNLQESSCVTTPKQNGIAERCIGYITSTARTLLVNYSIPWGFWSEAILTASHLVNRLPSQTLQFSTLIELMAKVFPEVKLRTYLLPRVFGCTAYVHDTTPTLTKQDAKALKCVFVCYSSLQKGYRCYHPPTR